MRTTKKKAPLNPKSLGDQWQRVLSLQSETEALEGKVQQDAEAFAKNGAAALLDGKQAPTEPKSMVVDRSRLKNNRAMLEAAKRQYNARAESLRAEELTRLRKFKLEFDHTLSTARISGVAQVAEGLQKLAGVVGQRPALDALNSENSLGLAIKRAVVGDQADRGELPDGGLEGVRRQILNQIDQIERSDPAELPERLLKLESDIAPYADILEK